MPTRLDRFVLDENILNFKKQIAVETDPVRLELLKILLAEHELKAKVGIASIRPAKP